MSKMGVMQATEATIKTLEALAQAKVAGLQGLKFKRSAWDVVRRKKTPEQRAAKLVRIAGKWNQKFDVNKVDMQKLASSLEGITGNPVFLPICGTQIVLLTLGVLFASPSTKKKKPAATRASTRSTRAKRS